MNVKKIVKKYLTAHGFDGLYQSDDCSCPIHDLMHCDQLWCDCTAGYLVDGYIGPKE